MGKVATTFQFQPFRAVRVALCLGGGRAGPRGPQRPEALSGPGPQPVCRGSSDAGGGAGPGEGGGELGGSPPSSTSHLCPLTHPPFVFVGPRSLITSLPLPLFHRPPAPRAPAPPPRPVQRAFFCRPLPRPRFLFTDCFLPTCLSLLYRPSIHLRIHPPPDRPSSPPPDLPSSYVRSHVHLLPLSPPPSLSSPTGPPSPTHASSRPQRPTTVHRTFTAGGGACPRGARAGGAPWFGRPGVAIRPGRGRPPGGSGRAGRDPGTPGPQPRPPHTSEPRLAPRQPAPLSLPHRVSTKGPARGDRKSFIVHDRRTQGGGRRAAGRHWPERSAQPRGLPAGGRPGGRLSLPGCPRPGLSLRGDSPLSQASGRPPSPPGCERGRRGQRWQQW